MKDENDLIPDNEPKQCDGIIENDHMIVSGVIDKNGSHLNCVEAPMNGTGSVETGNEGGVHEVNEDREQVCGDRLDHFGVISVHHDGYIRFWDYEVQYHIPFLSRCSRAHMISLLHRQHSGILKYC